ncbi:dynein regulatory complex subunit 4-like [Anableps anableps]
MDTVTTEMSKDQLWEFSLRLQEELEAQRQERHFFQLERDNTRAIWELSRDSLEEAEVQLRGRRQKKSQVEERHRVELTVYKQKLKHVLSEQHNAALEMKVDAATASSLLQNQNSEAEVELHREFQELQTGSRQKQIQGYNTINKLKLRHEVAMIKLSGEYERRMQELEVRKLDAIRSMAEAFQKKQINALRETDAKMKRHLMSLNAEHDKSREKTQGLFEEYQDAKLYKRHTWKEEMKKTKKMKLQGEKEKSVALQENRRLKEMLQEVQQKLPELQRRLKEHQNSKDQMERYRAQQKRVSQELLDRMVEHELLQQAFQQVQQERDELLRRQTESVLDIQQRSSLKKILLQKKLEVLTETLETKEAQLSAALAVCSTEPAARSHAVDRLQEILESKRTTMEALQQDLDQESQEYQELLHSQEQPPETHRVSPLDLPFRAAEQTLKEAGSDRELEDIPA